MKKKIVILIIFLIIVLSVFYTNVSSAATFADIPIENIINPPPEIVRKQLVMEKVIEIIFLIIQLGCTAIVIYNFIIILIKNYKNVIIIIAAIIVLCIVGVLGNIKEIATVPARNINSSSTINEIENELIMPTNNEIENELIMQTNIVN